MSEKRIELVRGLGRWAAMAIVVGTIIGTGIFLKPGEMAAVGGSVSVVYAAWIVGGVLTLFGALSFAELGAAMPEAGGQYAYLTRGLGPVCGFLRSGVRAIFRFSGSGRRRTHFHLAYHATFRAQALRVCVYVGAAGGRGGHHPLYVHQLSRRASGRAGAGRTHVFENRRGAFDRRGGILAGPRKQRALSSVLAGACGRGNADQFSRRPGRRALGV